MSPQHLGAAVGTATLADGCVKLVFCFDVSRHAHREEKGSPLQVCDPNLAAARSFSKKRRPFAFVSKDPAIPNKKKS